MAGSAMHPMRAVENLRATAGDTPADARAEGYEHVYRTLPVPVLLVSQADLAILDANDAAVRRLGYPRDVLLDRHLYELLAEHELDRLIRIGDPEQALGMLLAARSRWILQGRHEEAIPMEVSPVEARFGEAQAVILYETLPSETETLRHDLRGPAAASFWQANDLPHFAFSAFHDLKEPMHLVTGYLRLLERHAAEHLTEKERQFIAYANEGTGRMNDLIMRVLDYFRVGAQKPRREAVSLTDALEDARRALRLVIDERAARIETSGALPTVTADRDQIVRLFTNLLSNAIKFTPGPAPRVQVGARRKKDQWEVWVKDHGIGIKVEDQERIFMPFQRLQSQDEVPGTGLGLATCRHIVAAHGGRIWAESSPGQGTAIRFILPEGGAAQ